MIPVMCCDTVNRGVAYADGKIILNQADAHVVALDAKTGKEVWRVKNGDPKKGETMTDAPHDRQGQGHRRHQRRRVRRARLRHRLQPRPTARWRGTPTRSGRTIRSSSTPRRPSMGKPVGKDSSAEDLAGRPVEDRRRHDLGLVHLRSAAEPVYYGSGNPEHLEPDAAARRQQVVDDDLRAQSRHRRGEVGLPDDAARRVGLSTASTR